MTAQQAKVAHLHRAGKLASEIARDLGASKTQIGRILRQLRLPTGHATRKKRAEELLGPDIPYSIQITAGVPCQFSVHFEGTGLRVEARTLAEEAQEVER
jgi:transcriptional regulator